MLHSIRLAALIVAAMIFAETLSAETTPAPPDWQDGRGPSVYGAANQQAAAPSLPSATVNGERYSAAPALETPQFDSAVKPAVHEAPAESESPSRRLAPPTSRSMLPSEQRGSTTAGAHRMLDFGIPVQSIYTVATTALALVIGAFLVFAWALRRGGKNSHGRRGLLPADAVSVLGRVPIAARQFAELLRVGNKLVLVALTPNGPTTLTEVTDPAEVDRLVGLCQQLNPQSTTKAFEQVFQQLSSEPAAGGFFGSEPMPTSLSSLSPAASAYRSHRGTGRV